MTKYFTNNQSIINLYKKPSYESEVVTQIIFGESFSIIKKNRNWLKIKIKEDGYCGYLKNSKFSDFLKASHKIDVLKANVYKFSNKNKKIYELTFGSKIKILDIKNNFYKFSKGWILKKNVKPITFHERDIFKKVNIFRNIKYKWGGKSFKGIDCSGLVQIFLNFNNKYCPRDAKDQVKFFKKNVKLNKIKKNNLIFWKGHVAIILSKKKLIHAYGPAKKTVLMNVNDTIRKIKSTANLDVIGIKKI